MLLAAVNGALGETQFAEIARKYYRGQISSGSEYDDEKQWFRRNPASKPNRPKKRLRSEELTLAEK